jgi:HrpA-like RNA helicase
MNYNNTESIYSESIYNKSIDKSNNNKLYISNLDNINLIDPLDINATSNNFINNNILSEKYKELAKNWSKYPVYSDKSKLKEFFTLLDKNQVLLVVSGTGSGKTVIC